MWQRIDRLLGQSGFAVALLLQMGIAFMFSDWLAVRRTQGSAVNLGEVVALIVAFAFWSLPMMGVLARNAHERGYRRSWGLLGLLSIAGWAVVVMLPLRAEQRGFDVAASDDGGVQSQ